MLGAGFARHAPVVVLVWQMVITAGTDTPFVSVVTVTSPVEPALTAATANAELRFPVSGTRTMPSLVGVMLSATMSTVGPAVADNKKVLMAGNTGAISPLRQSKLSAMLVGANGACWLDTKHKRLRTQCRVGSAGNGDGHV